MGKSAVKAMMGAGAKYYKSINFVDSEQTSSNGEFSFRIDTDKVMKVYDDGTNYYAQIFDIDADGNITGSGTALNLGSDANGLVHCHATLLDASTILLCAKIYSNNNDGYELDLMTFSGNTLTSEDSYNGLSGQSTSRRVFLNKISSTTAALFFPDSNTVVSEKVTISGTVGSRTISVSTSYDIGENSTHAYYAQLRDPDVCCAFDSSGDIGGTDFSGATPVNFFSEAGVISAPKDYTIDAAYVEDDCILLARNKSSGSGASATFVKYSASDYDRTAIDIFEDDISDATNGYDCFIEILSEGPRPGVYGAVIGVLEYVNPGDNQIHWGIFEVDPAAETVVQVGTTLTRTSPHSEYTFGSGDRTELYEINDGIMGFSPAGMQHMETLKLER